jgi:hypothetical protein
MLVFVFTLIYDREAVFYRKIPIQPGVARGFCLFRKMGFSG